MAERLAPFSVFIRYSLDAYETFFPSLMERDDAPISHRSTIGNYPWVLSVRADLGRLLDTIREEHGGLRAGAQVQWLD